MTAAAALDAKIETIKAKISIIANGDAPVELEPGSFLWLGSGQFSAIVSTVLFLQLHELLPSQEQAAFPLQVSFVV